MTAWRIYRREMLGYFLSPIAYVILFVFMLLNGFTFYFNLVRFDGDLELLLAGHFGNGLQFWFLSLLVPPLLTMRSFAEEKRSGTYELLVTSGVSEIAVVGGKFAAAWSFFIFLWLVDLLLFVLLGVEADLPLGVLAATHLGVGLLGSILVAFGLLMSSLTGNQLVAASVAIVGNLFLFFAHSCRDFFEVGAYERRYFDYISPLYHFGSDFASGVLDLRYVVLYLSLTLFFLFLTAKSLERRRWW